MHFKILKLNIRDRDNITDSIISIVKAVNSKSNTLFVYAEMRDEDDYPFFIAVYNSLNKKEAKKIANKKLIKKIMDYEEESKEEATERFKDILEDHSIRYIWIPKK